MQHNPLSAEFHITGTVFFNNPFKTFLAFNQPLDK